MDAERSPLRRWILPAAVAAATVVAFWPSLHAGFLNWDDEKFLVENLQYRGWGPQALRWMWTTFLSGPYMPLTWMSFALDFKLWGMNPAGYHLTNLLFHVGNAILVYAIAARLLKRTEPESAALSETSISWAAAWAALLFAIHPLRVESVSWVIERKDVLSGFFYFSTLLCYLRYADLSPSSPGRKRAYGLTVVLAALSLLAKASTMGLPGVFLLLDLYPLRRLNGLTVTIATSAKSVWVEKIPFFLMSAVAAALAAHGQVAAGMAASLDQVRIDQRLCLAAYGTFFYLGKLLYPAHLIPLYPVHAPVGFHVLRYLLSSIGVAGMTLYLLLARQRRPAWVVSWFYYLVMLAPVSGLFQSGSQAAADRYTYLSCVGWCMLGAGGLCRLWTVSWGDSARKLWRAGLVLTAVVSITALGLLTYRQAGRWRDGTSLWSYVLSQDPQNAFAYYNLGDVAQQEGRPQEALMDLQRSLALYPDPAVFYKLGVVLQSLGRREDAADHYQSAIALKPAHADAQIHLINLLSSEGKTAEAIHQSEQALQVLPQSAVLHNNLGVMYLAQNRNEEAIAHLQAAARLDSANPDFQRNLASAMDKKEWLDAVEKFEALLKKNPNDMLAHDRLSVLFLSHQDGVRAEPHIRIVLRQSPGSAQVNNNLGVSLVMQGRFQEGIHFLDNAIRLDPTSVQFARNREAALKQARQAAPRR